MNLEKLIEGINMEIESLEILFYDITNFPSILADRTASRYDKAAIALMLSQFFNGIESILKRILDYHSIKLKRNEQYHVEIISAFSGNSIYHLPVIFSNEIIDGFSILRRFRHYVFNGYSFRLDWDRLSIAVESLPPLFKVFKENLFVYINGINIQEK